MGPRIKWARRPASNPSAVITLYRVVYGESTDLRLATKERHDFTLVEARSNRNVYRSGDGLYTMIHKNDGAMVVTEECTVTNPSTIVVDSDDSPTEWPNCGYFWRSSERDARIAVSAIVAAGRYAKEEQSGRALRWSDAARQPSKLGGLL